MRHVLLLPSYVQDTETRKEKVLGVLSNVIRFESRFAGLKSSAAFLPPGSFDWKEIKELTTAPPVPPHHTYPI